MQEWVDGFSGLPNYTKESIEAWYKLQPKAVKYPEVPSAIRLGFDNTMIDDAIKSLIVEKDADKLTHAKEVLVREMSTTFSLGTADASVLDLNDAIRPPLEAKDVQGELPVGTKVICNKTGNKGTIMKFISWNQYIVDFNGNQMQVTGDDFTIAPREDEGAKEPATAEDIKENKEELKDKNFSALNDNKLNEVYNYIAELNKCKAEDVKKAVDSLAYPYPTSRHFIEMTFMKRYHFPIDSDGQPLDTIMKYVQSEEDARRAKAEAVTNFSLTNEEKLAVIRNIIKEEGIQAKDEMINDLANIYFTMDDADGSASKALTETFKFYDIDLTDDAIKAIFQKISDKYQALDDKNFSRKDCMEELSEIFKKHNLGLGINEVKIVYDELIKNDLDLDKTAAVLVGVKTNSNSPLQPETAKEVLQHFIQSVKEKHLSDGFINFSIENQENFNKLAEDAMELADLAVQAGLDDKFIFDNYDHLMKDISDCESAGEFLVYMTTELLDKKQFKKPEEAALAAQDFYEVLHDSNWKKKHIRARNFSENIIDRLYNAGYSVKEIAIKVHEPVAKVQDIVNTLNNFSKGKVVARTAKFIALKGIPGPIGHFLNNHKLFYQINNIVTILMGLNLAADFIVNCIWKIVDAFKKKTDEERYEEVMKIIETDKRYKSRAGRMAKAFLTKVHHEKLDKALEGIAKEPVKAKSFSRKVVVVEDK
jgi:hypothetical protein